MPEWVVSLKQRELQRVPIDAVRTTIGRDTANTVVIDNAGVSRLHASVVWEDPEFVLVDEGSQNGLFVNGTRTRMHRLRHGDLVQVGKFELLWNTQAGPPVSRFKRRIDPVRPVNNPLQTTALTAEEVRRYIEEEKARLAREAAPPKPRRQPQVATPPDPTRGLRRWTIALGITAAMLGAALVWSLLR